MADFKGLGDLTGREFLSKGFGISPDGNFAFGYSDSTPGLQAFRREISAAQPVGLGDLAGGAYKSTARASNTAGTVVVGRGTSLNAFAVDGQEAFRWEAGQINGLGRIPGHSDSEARDISANGNVIVGRSWAGINHMDAVIFSMHGIPGCLPHLPGGRDVSIAHGVSANERVIVGQSESNRGSQSTEAVRWLRRDTGWTGLQSLHPVGTAPVFGKALATNRNGRVIVGQMYDEDLFVAFRWVRQSGGNDMVALRYDNGVLVTSRARDVSSDGKTVVGEFQISGYDEAFVWRENVDKMERVFDVLPPNKRPTGWTLQQAHSVSADGNRIVGTGEDDQGRPQGWFADIS